MLKTKICIYWKNGNCKNNEKCNFAHSNNELVKVINTKCLNGGLCYDQDCIFDHPYDWNAFENKIQCIFCSNNSDNCNKKNKKYNHIEIGKVNEINTSKRDYENENDFPKLLDDIKETIDKDGNEDIEKINIPEIIFTINGKQINDLESESTIFDNINRKINEKEVYDKISK